MQVSTEITLRWGDTNYLEADTSIAVAAVVALTSIVKFGSTGTQSLDVQDVSNTCVLLLNSGTSTELQVEIWRLLAVTISAVDSFDLSVLLLSLPIVESDARLFTVLLPSSICTVGTTLPLSSRKNLKSPSLQLSSNHPLRLSISSLTVGVSYASYESLS